MANVPALVRVAYFVVFGRNVESRNVRLQNMYHCRICGSAGYPGRSDNPVTGYVTVKTVLLMQHPWPACIVSSGS